MGISYSPLPGTDTTDSTAPLVMTGTGDPDVEPDDDGAAYLDADTGDVWRSQS